MTKSIDGWAAAKCGVELSDTPKEGVVIIHVYWRLKGQLYFYPWTIKDPRCRDTFRTWWLSQNKSRKVTFHFHGVSYIEAWDNGFHWNGIKEEDCIEKIYEAEK